jgi:uncharacterized protein YceH (UPF0502 family)
VGERFEEVMCAFVEQERQASAAAGKASGDAATTEALRAEIARLEARVRELEAQLRQASGGPPATPR